MFKKNAFSFLVLVIVVTTLAGCAKSTTAPSTPIQTKMVLSDLPEINEPVDLIFTVSVHQSDAPNTKAVITLPDDTVVVDGELEWNFDLLANESKTFTLTIMFTTLGNKKIRGGARCEKGPNDVMGDASAIFFHITEEGGFEGMKYVPVETVKEVKPSTGMTTKMFFSNSPEINEPIDFVFTVSTIQDAPNTEVLIALPDDAVVVDGELKWSGDILANESKTFTLTIMFTTLGNKEVVGKAHSEKGPDGVMEDASYIHFYITEDGSFEGWQFEPRDSEPPAVEP